MLNLEVGYCNPFRKYSPQALQRIACGNTQETVLTLVCTSLIDQAQPSRRLTASRGRSCEGLRWLSNSVATCPACSQTEPLAWVWRTCRCALRKSGAAGCPSARQSHGMPRKRQHDRTEAVRGVRAGTCSASWGLASSRQGRCSRAARTLFDRTTWRSFARCRHAFSAPGA